MGFFGVGIPRPRMRWNSTWSWSGIPLGIPVWSGIPRVEWISKRGQYIGCACGMLPQFG